MYVDAISSQELDVFDELDKRTVSWNGRSVVEWPNRALNMSEFKEMMASCSVRRKKGDEEVEIKVQVDTRKPKPEPKPPEKPK